MIKATSKEAKKLASRLVQDHKKANSHLKKLADAKGVTLPAEPNATAQATFKQLEKKQGAEFDKMFAKDAVKDHKKDISTFEQVAKNTKDNDVKAFAEKTLPVLKEHLSLAEAANGKK